MRGAAAAMALACLLAAAAGKQESLAPCNDKIQDCAGPLMAPAALKAAAPGGQTVIFSHAPGVACAPRCMPTCGQGCVGGVAPASAGNGTAGTKATTAKATTTTKAAAADGASADGASAATTKTTITSTAAPTTAKTTTSAAATAAEPAAATTTKGAAAAAATATAAGAAPAAPAAAAKPDAPAAAAAPVAPAGPASPAAAAGNATTVSAGAAAAAETTTAAAAAKPFLVIPTLVERPETVKKWPQADIVPSGAVGAAQMFLKMGVDDDRTGLEKKLAVDGAKDDLVEIASPHTVAVDSDTQL